uniref:Uncharacterized protein n=1 Tax=Vespula pensylvanica TaxID=30213 RepID=A0A834UBG8_VESPE|nr:hypothetical protein H0235_005639 [Vespula pensylvanica]
MELEGKFSGISGDLARLGRLGQPPIDSSPPRVECEQGRGVDSIRGQKKLPVGVADGTANPRYLGWKPKPVLVRRTEGSSVYSSLRADSAVPLARAVVGLNNN